MRKMRDELESERSGHSTDSTRGADILPDPPPTSDFDPSYVREREAVARAERAEAVLRRIANAQHIRWTAQQEARAYFTQPDKP